MEIWGEEIISTALDKVGDALIQKMNNAEELRNREFTYQLKELEFYKQNYGNEIKSIFDRWFGYLQNILILSNNSIDDATKRRYQKKVDDFMRPENVISLKVATMKYCGTETGKALALFSQLSYNLGKREDIPKFAIVYVTCFLLSTMKQEILGQTIDPLTILKILLTDYEEKADIVNLGMAYVIDRRKELFPEE